MESEYQKNSLKCTSKMLRNTTCSNPSCFFCTICEADPSIRRPKIAHCFKEMPLRYDQEHVLVLSGLWNIAMTRPDDPEFPSLGIFECLGKMIDRAIKDKAWLLKDQNIYIPYYAAHIIGSYTLNNPEFAELAINSGVVYPLIELLRGRITWIEQRVAVRALGHLASHDTTFETIAEHQEIIQISMELACNCLHTIYKKFVGVNDTKRLKYHCDLITRGVGGKEIENIKVEEWASQLQCWSLYLLNCFVRKERFISVICKKEFLKDLCGMRSGLGNRSSPGGIGLLTSLCNTQTGRVSVANLEEVTVYLCHTSRSSDDWQYMAIDSLLLLLKDMNTRYKVIQIAALFLADLVELRSLNERTKVGDTITQVLLQDYHKIKYAGMNLKSKIAEEELKKIWDLKVERRKREELMSAEELKEKKELTRRLKQEGNEKFCSGYVEKAIMKYTKALDLCPLKKRKERIVLYSNRAQGYLLLRNPDAAISDSTRALCLSATANPHSRSLWRRSQAYDMKGMAKESLMDCLMFINGRIKSDKTSRNVKNLPYYAARMFNKQMNATWLFAAAKLRNKLEGKGRQIQRRRHGDDDNHDGNQREERRAHHSRRIVG